jgi:hypothetical protein
LASVHSPSHLSECQRSNRIGGGRVSQAYSITGVGAFRCGLPSPRNVHKFSIQ